MFICPACQRRASAPKYSVDFEHNCPDEVSETLREIDRLNITGEGANWRGAQDKLFGKRSHIEGERHFNPTPRGKNDEIYDQVERIEHISLKKKRGFHANKGE